MILISGSGPEQTFSTHGEWGQKLGQNRLFQLGSVQKQGLLPLTLIDALFPMLLY